MLHLHNLLRWVILVLLLVAIFRHLGGMNKKRLVNAGDQKVDLFLMISAHLTFVVGLYLYFVRPSGFKLFKTAGDQVGEQRLPLLRCRAPCRNAHRHRVDHHWPWKSKKSSGRIRPQKGLLVLFDSTPHHPGVYSLAFPGRDCKAFVPRHALKKSGG